MHYEQQLRAYVLERADALCKPPRSFIKYPFIDPGSAYEGNVWDWDTFWSVYGLLNLPELSDTEAKRQKLMDHAKGNVRNFIDHQLEDGYIPMMIEVADWPEPYLNMKHKEGVQMNMHKPFLCSQICLISKFDGDYSWAAPFFENLERYFAYYRSKYYFDNSGLYVWCNDIMIGMDNDPATFGRPDYSTANIFLNSFMVTELRAMETLCVQFGKGEQAAHYQRLRVALTEAIQAECWDRRDRFFYSVDVDIKTRQYDWFHQGLPVFWKTLPIKIRVWSGFIPLYAGIATKEQAAALVKHIEDTETFACDFGIATLGKDEKMFDLSPTINPSNWLGPVWMVANYVVFRGLMNYGYEDAAKTICEGTLRLLGEDLEKSGTLHEYYSPLTGEPIMNGGFINWNVLALNMADELRGKEPLCNWNNSDLA